MSRLQAGDSVGVAGVVVGDLALSDHAEMYFDNAVALCRPDGVADFRVFLAMYAVRHGLELWLKCLLRNRKVDAFLALVAAEPAYSFLDLTSELALAGAAGNQLRSALCKMRNVVVDGRGFPGADPGATRQETRWADEALRFLREHPETPRMVFSTVWQIPLGSHDLGELWASTWDLLESFSSCGLQLAHDLGLGPGLPVGEIGALVALLHHLDEGGDAFRYPMSLAGEWHTGLPHIGMEPLGALALELRDTVRFITAVRTAGYEYATVGRANPFLYLPV